MNTYKNIYGIDVSKDTLDIILLCNDRPGAYSALTTHQIAVKLVNPSKSDGYAKACGIISKNDR